ncbi:hypothetical protein BST81_18690 [Leptolyngbya sp. 'hensonii']|uniref:energy transducer TonB n=1 Tax=Leptolyngbya sp. 'hensonii' TaxID=1922337 RepID=UPI00094FD296|nr:energy transducer TonB [Leptolyngbya sp. 'hensonii']OLP17005.1 hypothetical protein BST81_18690 [Leptolyngbya sp. 'hensonii']
MGLSSFADSRREQEEKVLLVALACSLLGSVALHSTLGFLRVDRFSPVQTADEESWTEVVVTEDPAPPPEAPEAPRVEPAPDVAVLPPATIPIDRTELPPEADPAPGRLEPTARPVAALQDFQPGLAVRQAIPGRKTVVPSFGDRLRDFRSLFGGASPSRTGGSALSLPTGKGPTGSGMTPNLPATPTATGTTTPTPAQNSSRTVCVSCPKPQYQGTQGSARVVFDIDPNGNVVNVRLRQSSGDARTDQATLEAVRKWKFSPSDGGQRGVRKKVTFEEEGSSYQQQNQQRRSEAQKRREAQQSQPNPAPAVSNSPSVSPPASPNPAAPAAPATPVPAPAAPAAENTPAPVPAEPAPPPPAPAPAEPAPPPPAPAPAEPAPPPPAPAPSSP